MSENAENFAPKVFEPLPLGAIRAKGWLHNQLQIQASGLSGNLDDIWDDIKYGEWLGGTRKNQEVVQYWLDGALPLAVILDDKALKNKVYAKIGYILKYVAKNGWIGPPEEYNQTWPSTIILKVLIQYYQATHDPRVMPTLYKFFQYLQEVDILVGWGDMRWPDLVISIHWFYEQQPEEWLLKLAQKFRDQGFAWHKHFDEINFQANYKERVSVWAMPQHGVNSAMAIKYAAVMGRHTNQSTDPDFVLHPLRMLDEYHGQVTGVFSADEVYAGKNPSQGTELCVVVEEMFSLECMMAISGEPSIGDKLERITFNALPSTFTPDMWAHQYDQQVNQAICIWSHDNIYTTNGPDANMYGLAPNYMCCLANFSQGFPKFAAHLWMGTADHGIAAISYAPCEVNFTSNGQPVYIEVDTEYPFSESVNVQVTTQSSLRFPILLRIPEWAKGAYVEIDGQREEVTAGRFARIEREWSNQTRITLYLPMQPIFTRRFHNSLSIERGPLVYALPIPIERTLYAGELPHADWELRPAGAWNYALDPSIMKSELLFEQKLPLGATPFSQENPPVSVKVRGRKLPSWRIAHSAADTLPISPVKSSQPLEDLILVPFGCTNLRIAEFPVLDEG
jgi:uncharacterized protein